MIFCIDYALIRSTTMCSTDFAGIRVDGTGEWATPTKFYLILQFLNEHLSSLTRLHNKQAILPSYHFILLVTCCFEYHYGNRVVAVVIQDACSSLTVYCSGCYETLNLAQCWVHTSHFQVFTHADLCCVSSFFWVCG